MSTEKLPHESKKFIVAIFAFIALPLMYQFLPDSRGILDNLLNVAVTYILGQSVVDTVHTYRAK